MRRTIPLLVFLGALASLSCEPKGSSKSTLERDEKAARLATEELGDATTVLGAMAVHVSPEQRARAKCVVVVPGMVTGAFLLGGQHGDGVVSCRTPNGWSGPAFIKITGVNAGVQAGVQSADLLMLVMVEGAPAKLFRKDFHLGADASVAAGPVGEGKQASTDIQMKADILTYQRAKGLFAGADVSGVGVKQNLQFARALYGPIAEVGAVLTGEVPAPKEADAFLEQLRSSFPAK